MILTCPECATRYEVDGSKFPAEGRKVRCKKCGHVWHQAAETHDAERAEIEEAVFNPPPPPPPEPEPAAPAVEEAEPQPEPQWRAPAEDSVAEEPAAAPLIKRLPAAGMLTAAGWVGLVAVILVIGWSAASYRSQIVNAWPRSASLFSRLGMAVNTRGIDFTDVRHTNQIEDGQPVLVITGKLVNVSGRKLDVPPLRVTLSDAGKRPLYDWSFEPTSTALAPGQSVAFHTRLSNPPAAARHVDLRFADGKE
ncbi:MAG: DUF3426 domain-containing protein [Rhizomicrobium sp.]